MKWDQAIALIRPHVVKMEGSNSLLKIGRSDLWRRLPTVRQAIIVLIVR